jgi:hypothetical protein
MQCMRSAHLCALQSAVSGQRKQKATKRQKNKKTKRKRTAGFGAGQDDRQRRRDLGLVVCSIVTFATRVGVGLGVGLGAALGVTLGMRRVAAAEVVR